jgi:uncharacterized membrane protein YphA (DoxX/SURF4 family)
MAIRGLGTQGLIRAARPRSLHLSLWIAQVLLALAFAMAGLMKLTQPIATLAASLVWPGDVPPALVRFIGGCEVLGAIGLILPAATGVQPKLTSLAATGLLAVMLLAIPFHLSRGEMAPIPVNVVLGAVALFIARFRWIPRQTR